MVRVFDTLASVGNDSAACDAFRVLCQVFTHTERIRRRAELMKFALKKGHETKHPFHPSERLEAVVDRELQLEILEFIRTRFWMMPLVIPEDIRWVDKRAKEHREQPTADWIALSETRKEMIRVTAKCLGWGWRGIPGDKVHETVFAMLCSMSNAYHGACPAQHQRQRDYGQLFCGIITQVFREELQSAVQMSGYDFVKNERLFNWKYWLNFDKNPAECRVLREVLAKTRAATIGPDGVLADIEARERLEAVETNTREKQKK